MEQQLSQLTPQQRQAVLMQAQQEANQKIMQDMLQRMVKTCFTKCTGTSVRVYSLVEIKRMLVVGLDCRELRIWLHYELHASCISRMSNHNLLLASTSFGKISRFHMLISEHTDYLAILSPIKNYYGKSTQIILVANPTLISHWYRMIKLPNPTRMIFPCAYCRVID